MSKEYNKTGQIQWIRRILGKLIRTVPSLLAVVLFYAWIWEHLNSGPQWGDLVVQNANLCKTGFWKNILQIQNWFSFEETVNTFIYSPINKNNMHFFLVCNSYKSIVVRVSTIGFGTSHDMVLTQ